MTNLETLKTEFINALDWNEEESIICNNNGQDIRDYLETYAIKIADEKGLKIEVLEHQYPIEFSDDNAYIYLQILCEIKGNMSNENSNYLNINFDSNFNYNDIVYDEQKNLTSFTFYTSINIEEKLEELKAQIEE